jgi:hypothetical protein
MDFLMTILLAQAGFVNLLALLVAIGLVLVIGSGGNIAPS